MYISVQTYTYELRSRYIYIYIYIYTCIHICLHNACVYEIHTYTHIYAVSECWTNAYVYTRKCHMHTYILHAHIHTYTHMSIISMYVYIHTCMHTHTHVCTYLYKHTHTNFAHEVTQHMHLCRWSRFGRSQMDSTTGTRPRRSDLLSDWRKSWSCSQILLFLTPLDATATRSCECEYHPSIRNGNIHHFCVLPSSCMHVHHLHMFV